MAPKITHTRESLRASIWKTGGCWLWMPKGFQGVYKATPKIKIDGFLQRVANVVWVYEGNALEANQYLQRTCKELSCVNPLHHEAKSDLLADYGVAAINAVRTHCTHGHLLSGANLYVAPGSGQRKCRKCMKSRQLKNRDRVDTVRVLDGSKRPTRDELAQALAAGRSYVQLAGEYGLSDVAIRRWAKKWGLASTRGKARG